MGTIVPWDHASLHPTGHLYRFSQFLVTNTQRRTEHETSAGVLCSVCSNTNMRPSNKILISQFCRVTWSNVGETKKKNYCRNKITAANKTMMGWLKCRTGEWRTKCQDRQCRIGKCGTVKCRTSEKYRTGKWRTGKWRTASTIIMKWNAACRCLILIHWLF